MFGFPFQRRFNNKLSMPDTRNLLADYVKNGSEAAFRELVARYINLVYSTALRLVANDTQLAQDVAQTVFIDLARKAHTFSSEVMLGGWLHQRTFNVATTAMRGERRRRDRERIAVEMNLLQQPDNDLAQIAPLLDAAITQLAAEDRTAILLRFFEQRDFRTVGEALGASEDAARMRVSRALEKLHLMLTRQGVTLSSAAVGAALTTGAVTAAPAGLATTVAGAALATSAATAGTYVTLLKIMAMTKVKAGMAGAIVIVAVGTPLILQHQSQLKLHAENTALRRQIDQLAQLTADNERLSNLLAHAASSATPRLPAPPVKFSAAPPETNPTDAIIRVLRSEEVPTLTAQQLESYLRENRRNAASLLAAFRTTGDPTLLQEAMEKFPNDPHVAFTAALRKDGSAEDRRHWLNVLKQTDPDNSLANYLLALESFKSGQIDQAVQEVSAASDKSLFTDYTKDFYQNDEEAWRAAGYSIAEAKTIGTAALVLPHLAPYKELGLKLADLARAYRQAGDDASAQLTLEMALNLGERLDTTAGTPLITQLVGRAIQGIALRELDPNSLLANSGHTVQQRLDDLTRQRENIRDLTRGFDELMPKLSEQDWISYKDRWRSFGEEAALRWLRDKYGVSTALQN